MIGRSRFLASLDAARHARALVRAFRHACPSEWPAPGRHAFTGMLAGLVCVLGLLGADGPARWQDADAQRQRRAAVLAQRAQLLQAIAQHPVSSRSTSRTPPQAATPTAWTLLQAWRDAAQQSGWQIRAAPTVSDADASIHADGGLTLQLQLQGDFADWSRWWSHWQDRAGRATLTHWHLASRAPRADPVDGTQRSVAAVDIDLTVHMPPPDETELTPTGHAAAQGHATWPSSVDAAAWVQHHWQRAQTDARVARWWPRWQAAPTALTHTAETDLHYLGRLQSSGRDVALVHAGTGDGAVHAVAVGDALGPHLGRVLQIDDAGVRVQQWRRDVSGAWQSYPVVLLRSPTAVSSTTPTTTPTTTQRAQSTP